MRVYSCVCIQASAFSTNPGSMEDECEYGLTSGTCFTARHLEVVAVAGLLWIFSVVCFFSVWWDFVFFFRFLYLERTRPTASTRQPCLMYLSTSTGVRTGCHCLICLSVCVCVCVTLNSSFLLIASCARPISTNPVSMEAGECGLTRGAWVFARRLELVAVAGCCGFGGVFSVGRIFPCFP